MEAGNDFLIELEKVLDQQKILLEQKVLPNLKETIRLFTSAFEGAYNLFLKKGLVAEDPYKYDQKISEITPPSTEQVLDSDKNNAISQRLSLYDSQLDFLNNFYQFSVEFITISRIKKIILLIKWIKWDRLSVASVEMNTRIFAELVEKITQGTDLISIKLLNDSLKRMSELSKVIVSILKSISLYQREKYKFQVRCSILTELGIVPDDMQTKPNETLMKIKFDFKRIMGKNFPFYTELIKEIFDEEAIQEGTVLKSNVLNKLKIKEVKPEEKKEINYRQLLMESLRILSSVSTPLEEALNKLDFNSSLIKEKKLSFGDKLRSWIMNFSKKDSSKKVIEIDIFDERLSSSKAVQLDFTEYLENGRRKVRTMAALINKVSATHRKLETASEDSILSFISKSLQDITIIANKMGPVNSYFKSEVGREQRKNLKGVKIEVTSIKNILIKCNRKRHEYISRMEEVDQMKKLGVM